MSKALTELIAPTSDRLVGHDHAALEEQLLNVAQAQVKAEIPTHSATDDAGRKTVTVIERFRLLHHVILRDRPNNLTMPKNQLGQTFIEYNIGKCDNFLVVAQRSRKIAARRGAPTSRHSISW
jgi:hypothetical protein